jgi:hypothetical protein
MSEPELKVGDRFQYEQVHTGVIRYTGKLPGAKEDVEWVGVEWDQKVFFFHAIY